MVSKIGFGLAVTVICMSIVFLVLIGLMYVIKIQRSIVEKIEEKRNRTASPEVQQTNAAQIIQENEDEELIAVISAAVAAVLGRPTSSIIVRSIRSLEPAAPSWAIVGRQDQMNSRF